MLARDRYLKDVATLEVFPDKCTGCKSCLPVCPHEVLYLNDDKRIAIADRDACMECGACMVNCPTEAIFVDSGVGCAMAVIAGALGMTESCCSVGSDNGTGKAESSCCG